MSDSPVYEFLSPDWIRAADDIRERFRDTAPEIELALRVNIEVSDTPEGVVDNEFVFDTSDGTVAMRAGLVEDAEVTISTDYSTAQQILLGDDPEQFMTGFLEGEIVVQGDMARLMVLQAMLAQRADNDEARAAGEALRAITAEV